MVKRSSEMGRFKMSINKLFCKIIDRNELTLKLKEIDGEIQSLKKDLKMGRCPECGAFSTWVDYYAVRCDSCGYSEYYDKIKPVTEDE